ncbi:hypothetical protein SAMN05660776_2157 [Salegentibacter holothuriorum]|uniref:Methyltransferase type 11 domain-containing protein n=1 Tax=Salegentibacter holothuriorum TaxID=241145 RepID=A0A1T5CRK3_9FLAO|nr:methyltransferase domain-containing protein [Salegentibacter holothuriorum]SKB62054.1 hypothetical protein SAMN05660776_2157 [Salegentibacter holothuriorum]
MNKYLKRLLKRPNWYNLRALTPVSESFGLDRGTPIDRIYIEDFLKKNSEFIKGRTMEIADDFYSRKFGNDIEKFEILHATPDNDQATVIGDLTDILTLPENRIDCFICTQTLNFIYNFKDAIVGTKHLLKEGGVVLATVAGISQVSSYDMSRWGDYWRFTTLSIEKSFEEVFGKGNVQVDFYGNVLSSIAFLQGLCAEDLKKDELFYKDPNYQMTIVVKAIKRTP